MQETGRIELTTHGTRKRRSLVSYFLFSIVAGGGFIKGVETFHSMYRMSEGFELSLIYFKQVCFIPLVFFITILRFYVGNILHMKINEDNPPQSSAFPWLVDFSVIMIQFSLFYLMGASLSSAEEFLLLLFILCVLDVIWLSFNWLVGKMRETLSRNKTPALWILLNFICAVFLCYLLFWFDGDLYTGRTAFKMSGITLTLLLFSIAAIVDVWLADYYLLLREGYGPQKNV